jgi:2-keto-4-pentenoate hydratase
MTHSAVAAARFIAEAHRVRAPYQNLPGDLAPANVDEAYATQEALAQFWQPERGPVAGLKIATTTKIMQELMGIDHPCGGMIYTKQIHASPTILDRSKYMHVVVECELAVRLGRDLPPMAAAYDRQSVRDAIGAVMPAFELIEDRNAVYKECKAMSLIADNAWNAGIVLGAEVPLPPSLELDGLTGSLEINGVAKLEGKTDDPLGALAWVANLAVSRGRPMRAGMVVITGSVIATLPIADGETFRFTVAGLGSTEMTAPLVRN